jgi:hypothetical protein
MATDLRANAWRRHPMLHAGLWLGVLAAGTSIFSATSGNHGDRSATSHRASAVPHYAGMENMDNMPASKPGQAALGHEKPDQYLYVWSGAVGRTQPDRVITLNFDPKSPNYGQMVADTIVPGPGGVNNEPHHCGVSANGMTLACGGLLSSLHHHPWNFFFSLANPAHPVLVSAQRTPLAAFPDAWEPLPDNGFLVTMMGSLTGGSPGRIAEYNGADQLVGMFPKDAPSAFNPHGIDVRPDLNEMVTCDYVDPASTLNSVPGPIVFRSTVRVWDLGTLTVEKTIRLPAGAATMDCLLLPHDPQGRGYVGGTMNGQLYLFNPHSGTASDVFNFDSIVKGALPQVMAISATGTRLFVPYSTANGSAGGVVMLDVSDPEHPRLLANLELGAGSGPHMAMLADNDTRLVVTDYFCNEDNFGKLHLDGDHFVRVLDVSSSGLTADPRFQVDFNTLIPGVELRPHGIGMSGMAMNGSD